MPNTCYVRLWVVKEKIMIYFILKCLLTIITFLAETILLGVREICALLTFDGRFMEGEHLSVTKLVWKKRDN